MLDVPASDIDIRERNPLALAFVGDGVLELLVRARLVAQSRRSAAVLHREAIHMVSAKGQFVVLSELQPLLTPEEADVVRRGRNATKAAVSKHASAEEYRGSTGLEALFGWLYLQDQGPRIQQLFDVIWQHYIQSQKDKKSGTKGG